MPDITHRGYFSPLWDILIVWSHMTVLTFADVLKELLYSVGVLWDHEKCALSNKTYWLIIKGACVRVPSIITETFVALILSFLREVQQNKTFNIVYQVTMVSYPCFGTLSHICLHLIAFQVLKFTPIAVSSDIPLAKVKPSQTWWSYLIVLWALNFTDV